MSELMTEILALRREVKQLQILIMKDKIDTTWVHESDAAEMLGLTGRTLRRHVQSGEYPFCEISFRNTNGRNWQYSRKSLMKFKTLTASNE